MVVGTHMDYIFPTENENVLLSQRWAHYILTSEFWISIHNVANSPILDKYENKMFVYLSFFGKGSSIVFRSSNLFQIQ